jgi:TonB family protein
MNAPRTLAVFLSFAAGIAIGIAAPRLIHGADKLLFPEHRHEIVRATSPDGAVDAVMEGIECGAPCSSGYAISIVAKGSAPRKDPVQQVFVANDVVNGQIRWEESHLLDISYDKAFIHNFRNVAYPFGRGGDVNSWRYAVEVHLTPSSPRFSYLAEENGNRASDGSGAPKQVCQIIFVNPPNPFKFIPKVLDFRRINRFPEVAYIVNEDGSVSDVKILKGTRSAKLDTQLVKSIRAWKYKQQPGCRFEASAGVIIDIGN